MNVFSSDLTNYLQRKNKIKSNNANTRASGDLSFIIKKISEWVLTNFDTNEIEATITTHTTNDKLSNVCIAITLKSTITYQIQAINTRL